MRRTTASLLLLTVPLALAACGDDDDEGVGASPSTETSAAAPTDPAPAGGSVTIDIAEFAFSPQDVEVAAGTEVVWTNADDFAHTAEAEDGSFDTGDLDAGASSEPVVFEEPGTYPYFCGIHNAMTGTITVTG